jgi:hypothetical protein
MRRNGLSGGAAGPALCAAIRSPTGCVEVTANPGDHRSCLIRLTPAGTDQMTRLHQVGLERFAKFVAE